MSWLLWSLLFISSLAIVGVYLSHMAGRLDRLHLKIEANKTGLHKALLLRATRAQALARDYPGNNRAAVEVIAIADESLTTDDPNRASWFVESRLTAALLKLSDEPDQNPNTEHWQRLALSTRKVALARTFYNDTTRMCQNLRKRRVVRWLRLAGFADYPQPVNFDDRAVALPEKHQA